ncbi:hypothetical protein GJ496_006286 [Pomphorhynchus laevis]|nr:hypothetical protein GJ496_006286 [Pomphorhynchus laevis]
MLDLLSTPIRYCGLGIERLEHSEHQFELSRILCECYLTDVTGDILRTTQKELLRSIRKKVPSGTANEIKFASEHRPPVWLSSIYLSVDKFHLTGDELRDAVSLRYNLDTPDVPNGKCFCGQGGTLSHMLSFVTMRCIYVRMDSFTEGRRVRDVLLDKHPDADFPDISMIPDTAPK